MTARYVKVDGDDNCKMHMSLELGAMTGREQNTELLICIVMRCEK